MQNKIFGLGDDWESVIDSLRKLVPVYDRLNAAISFKTDLSLRAQCIEGKINCGEKVLDAGSGNGVFSRILLKNYPEVGEVVLLDVLGPMLEESVKTLSCSKTHPVMAVFEYMPFRGEIFDTVLMGFSLRDAKKLELALTEVKRVLKRSGKLLVVDLGKPDDLVKSVFVGIYWLFLAPFIALVRLGKIGLNASAIYRTYRKLPRNRELKIILDGFFKNVYVRERFLGGAVLVEAY